MPRARDTRGQQRGSLAGQTFGPGGRATPVAALVAQQQEQNERFSKLLQTIEQMQQQNAEAVQQAAQAGGGAATQVANQVAAGIQRQQAETARQQERAEDRAFAEDMARLNAKMQSDAAREAAAMGQAIQGQREAIMRFHDQFLAKKASMDEAIAAYSARTDEMLAAGWFSSPEGRKELAKRKHLIDMMAAYSDDHFDDRHLAAAYELHNKNIQAVIDRDQDVMDLSRLQVEPLQLPMAQAQGRGRAVASPDSVPAEKMFEMKLYGGYPANGVVFNDEDNFGLPPGYSPRLMDAETMLEVLSRDDYLRFANDQSIRQELTRKNQEVVVQALDRLQPLKEQYENFNTTFNAMAPNAVERALENFLAEDNPHKFNDMGRTLTAGAIKEMFGGGRQGEEMAIIAMELFDGKREMTTPEEAFAAMALESAAFNIKEHMTSEFMNAGDEGQSLATQLVNQMVEEIGEEQASLALGVPPNALGLVRAQESMQARLSEAVAFANRMHDGLWKESVLESFRKDLRKFTRLADLYSMQVLAEGERKQERLMNLMEQDEALATVAEDVAGRSPEEISTAAGGMRDASKVEAGLTLMDSMIMIGEELGPDTLAEVATFVTGGLEPLDTPNLSTYIDQTRVEHERSGYAKAASDRASFHQKRQERARQRRQEQGPTFQESATERGAVGVVTEQVPALISLAGRGVGKFAERTGGGLVQMAAGRKATEHFARGMEVLKGRFPAMTPSEQRQIGNLTPEERAQVIRQSRGE